MKNKKIIAYLKEASYHKNVQIEMYNATLTITDTLSNAMFSITNSATLPEKYHCYFINNEEICWFTSPIGRGVSSNRAFDITTLPYDWGSDDLLILNNNISFWSSPEQVLVESLNYFKIHIDLLKTYESGCYLHLDNL